MTTLEILKGARAKVAQGWCQHAYALNSLGVSVGVKDEDACRWCPAGAVIALGDFDENQNAYDALLAAAEWPGAPMVTEWNDQKGRTQAEVLAAFDKAIASLS
jgi:hypothetical protein